MASEALLRANEKYRKERVKSFQVKFYPDDYALFEHLQKQEKKSEYIRELIRRDMNE